MCTRNEFKRDGAKHHVGSAECKFGESKIVSRSVMTLTGDTGYKTEINATYDPPFMGMKDSQTTLEGKYVGPCRDGMVPGDFIGPDGQKFNIKGIAIKGKPPMPPAQPARPAKGPAMSHNLHQHVCANSSSPPAPPATFYSLPALEKAGVGKVSRLPVSIRIVLESVLRNCDGKKVTEQHVRELANWKADRRARRRDSVRRRPRRAAGLHRRAAAGRPGGDAQRRAATWAGTRRPSSRWCRWTSSSTTR